MPQAIYTVDHVDPRGEVIVTAVKPLGPNESRHEQITATISVEMARRVRPLRGKAVHVHTSTFAGREAIVDIVPASSEAN